MRGKGVNQATDFSIAYAQHKSKAVAKIDFKWLVMISKDYKANPTFAIPILPINNTNNFVLK